MARPQLWSQLSDRQVFLTAPEHLSPTTGPPVTFTGLLPDMHHYHGRGGRVYPLWRDRAASEPNVKPALLAGLAKVYGQPVKAEDVMAYLAAVMAHPAFTARFKADLVRPGLHVPLTADAKLFVEAVALGTEVASAREGLAETQRGLGQAAQNDARFGGADRRKTDARAVESRSDQRASGEGWRYPCLSGCHPQPLAVVFGHAHGRSPAWQSSVPTIAPRVPATFSRRRGLRRLPGELSFVAFFQMGGMR